MVMGTNLDKEISRAKKIMGVPWVIEVRVITSAVYLPKIDPFRAFLLDEKQVCLV